MFVDSEPETTAPETTAPDGIWSESVRRHALAARVRPVPTSPDASPDDERLRILLVAPPWFPVPPTRYGGTEQVIGVLAEGLVRRGHDVTVLTTADSTTPGTIWATRDQSCPDLIGNWAIEIAHVVQAYRDDGDFDIIHDHTLTGAAVAACASHVPVVHTLHGQWTDDTTVVCRAISDHVNLVAISRDQAARAPDGVEIAATVHNGIDLDTFPYDADGGDHLGFLGRCGPDKSPELAIEAAHRLGRHMVMGIKVNEPDEWAWWYEQVEPLLDDHIEVIRNADHDQRLAILSGASAVLFPIQWPEPFGLVPVEANACGTPVVAFANGAAPEVVADGRSGIVVDPAAGVDGLVAAVPRAEALDRRECRDHVERSFSADRMVEDYLALYRRLVAAAGSRTPGRGVDHDSPLPKAG